MQSKKNIWEGRMRIDEFEFQDRNGNEIEPTKNQLVVYIKSLHKQIAELEKQLEKKEEYTYTGKEVGEIERKYDEKIDTLEQKLKSQPVEIVEKIKEQLIKRLNTIAGYGRMTTDELSFFIETEFGFDLDAILQEYQK